MRDNSPMFQHCGDSGNHWSVPKGRLRDRAPFQPSLRDLMTSALINPTLRRWAIVACPSATGFSRLLFCFPSLQMLAALDWSFALRTARLLIANEIEFLLCTV